MKRERAWSPSTDKQKIWKEVKAAQKKQSLLEQARREAEKKFPPEQTSA